MNNKIVNSLWIDENIGPLQTMCYNSYAANDHEFHLYTYQKINNLPASVIIRDANEIIDHTCIFKDIKSSYATFSDWFRIKLLHEVGGWWVDSDTICLKKFDNEDDYAFATEILDKDRTIAVCNAFIKLPKGSRIGERLLGKISEILENKSSSQIYWTEIGAGLLAEVINEYGMSEFLMSPHVFCPINYFDFKEIFQNENFKLTEDTYAVHLWNKMWEWSGTNLSKNGKKGTIFEWFQQNYLNK